MEDKDTCLMTNTAVTAAAGTTDYLSAGAVQNAPGANLYMRFDCTTTCDSATDAAVVTCSIQADDNTSFSTPTTLAASGGLAIGSANLIANGTTLVPIPYNSVPAEKYIRGYISPATENLTAGKFSVCIVTNPARNL